MTMAPGSELPIKGPQAATHSYSGSSPSRPAYGPSVTRTCFTCAILQAQQGLGLSSKWERVYSGKSLSWPSRTLVVKFLIGSHPPISAGSKTLLVPHV